MLEFNTITKHVQVDLSNGIYVSDNESGCGKTYLLKLCQSAAEAGICSICCITYLRDIDMLTYVTNILQKQVYDFILLDRYDLYVDTKINKCLQKVAETTPVFIDLKCVSRLDWTPFYRCSIDLTDKEISISSM